MLAEQEAGKPHELRARREHEQREGGEDCQVLARVCRDDERFSVATGFGAGEVDRDGDEHQRQDHEREREADHRFDRRQHEHVVADVAAEDRIGGTERRPVHRLQRRAPLRRHRQCDDEGDERRPRKCQRTHHARSVRTDDGGHAGDVGDRLTNARVTDDETAERIARVAVQNGEGDRAAQQRDAPLGDDLREEDALVADLREPEPVGEPPRDARQDDHEEEERDRRTDDETRWERRTSRSRSA